MADITRGGELQGILLLAALLARPLPGSGARLRLADIALARDDDGTVRVVVDGMDDERARALREEAARLGASIRFLPEITDGDDAVVHVTVPEPTGGGAQVRVSVSARRDRRELPLETHLVTAREDADGWAVEPPLHSAG